MLVMPYTDNDREWGEMLIPIFMYQNTGNNYRVCKDSILSEQAVGIPRRNSPPNFTLAKHRAQPPTKGYLPIYTQNLPVCWSLVAGA